MELFDAPWACFAPLVVVAQTWGFFKVLSLSLTFKDSAMKSLDMACFLRGVLMLRIATHGM